MVTLTRSLSERSESKRRLELQPTRAEALEAVLGPWDERIGPSSRRFAPRSGASDAQVPERAHSQVPERAHSQVPERAHTQVPERAQRDEGPEADAATATARARAAASTVCDPELPMLTIADLGVLRHVHAAGSRATVVITPTYSGCPMMDVIARDIAAAVREAGFADVDVRTVLAPAWTTDWLSADGRRKLEEFGIAPPTGIRPTAPVLGGLHVRCPHCRSLNTREISHFGSTACKALYECRACLEPFDYFKAH